MKENTDIDNRESFVAQVNKIQFNLIDQLNRLRSEVNINKEVFKKTAEKLNVKRAEIDKIEKELLSVINKDENIINKYLFDNSRDPLVRLEIMKTEGLSEYTYKMVKKALGY